LRLDAARRSPLPVGKLDLGLLRCLLAAYTHADERVVLGAGIGQDAAVIDMGGRYLVAKSDPITFATDEIGWYVLCVNANDIATCGAEPRWFLATLLLPEGAADAALVESLFAQLSDACRQMGVSLIGGHTEVTYGLERPIICGHMLGEVEKDRLVTTAGAQVGDAVVVTKGVPVEGTALIAREKRNELLRLGVEPEAVQEAARYLRQPGISVVEDSRVACRAGAIHAMHDPTEGGIATGLWEMALAAGVGLRIQRDSIPVLPLGRRFCGAFGLDVMGTIASGALLIAVAPQGAEAVTRALHQAGIAASRIGEVVPEPEGVLWLRDGMWEPIPRFDQDEIARLF
jgi:hydrogenase expression/formation protein HypE